MKLHDPRPLRDGVLICQDCGEVWRDGAEPDGCPPEV